ncbi:hypothetical protein J27TS8_02280 [Robertmurraya siralis]|uniref:Uncharacterized protein n=1 Tax=Robertmurraya siralis TaxID=77777 RepID=A0A919WE66_9BACI|nr:hypothetical protein J27TS8_02280 [Robertmurraya siralis]
MDSALYSTIDEKFAMNNAKKSIPNIWNTLFSNYTWSLPKKFLNDCNVVSLFNAAMDVVSGIPLGQD